MPTLPGYESNQNINTTPAGVQRNVVAENFKPINQMVETLTDVTQKLSDANDIMQETKAKTTVETALQQQEVAAQNDPNPDNLESHLKATQAIIKNAPKIDNQAIAGNINLQLQQNAFLTDIKIQDMFKKKQIFANDLSLDQLATTASFNKANAVSEAAGQQDEDNFMHTVSQNVNTGLITPNRGMELVKQYKLGVVKNYIMKDDSTTLGDSQIYKDLTDGKYGNLDLKETEQATNMIKSKIRDNVQIKIGQTLNNRISITKGIASGDFDWKNSDQIDKISFQDPKLGEALQAVVKSEAEGKPYKPENEQNQNFADLVNKVFASKTKEEVSDYIINTLHSSAERNMSKDRMAILISAAEQRGASLPTNKESGNGKLDENQKRVSDLVNSIGDFFKGSPNSDGIYVDFAKNVQSGMGPDEAKQKAVNSYYVSQYPWVSQCSTKGTIKVDKSGNKRLWFPDGHSEDVK